MGGNPTGKSSSNASRHKNKYSCDENISIHKYMSNDKNRSNEVNDNSQKQKNSINGEL